MRTACHRASIRRAAASEATWRRSGRRWRPSMPVQRSRAWAFGRCAPCGAPASRRQVQAIVPLQKCAAQDQQRPAAPCCGQGSQAVDQAPRRIGDGQPVLQFGLGDRNLRLQRGGLDLDAVGGAGHGGIDVAPHEPADHDDAGEQHHRPGQAVELPRGVQQNQKGADEPGENVKTEPGSSAPPARAARALAQRVERLGAVVAALAVDAAMLLRHTVQGLVLLVAAAVAGGVVTARFVEPGVRVLRDGLQVAVAIGTLHAIVFGHRTAQAFGLRAGVAVVAALLRRGQPFLPVLLVHGLGKVGHARHARARPARWRRGIGRRGPAGCPSGWCRFRRRVAGGCFAPRRRWHDPRCRGHCHSGSYRSAFRSRPARRGSSGPTPGHSSRHRRRPWPTGRDRASWGRCRDTRSGECPRPQSGRRADSIAPASPVPVSPTFGGRGLGKPKSSCAFWTGV